MFPFVLDKLCNGQRCNPEVSYDTYLCNARAFASNFEKDASSIYAAESAEEGNEQFIAHDDIANALAHQHRVEERMKKIGEYGNTSLSRSLSFAESTLSRSSSTVSAMSVDSTYNSVFSASTAITGHNNKYGIPSPSSTQKTRIKNRLQLASKRDRYAMLPPSSRGSNDWDYAMDVELEEEHMNVNKKTFKVLHLKMKAQMSDFYREEFLLSFPQYPIPKEMDMRKAAFQSNWGSLAAKRKKSSNSLPGLMKSLSSASSSSEHSSALPSLMANTSTPVLLAVDNSSFLDVAVSGCLGLLDSHSRTTSPIRHGNPNKNFLVIGNGQSKKAMLICFLKSMKGKPEVRIYATNPFVPEQESITTSDDLGLTKEESFPLYSWAEMRIENEFPDENAKYLLHMSNGTKGKFDAKPLYSAYHECAGSTDVNILRRKVDLPAKQKGTHEEPQNNFLHCARVCVRTDSNMCNQETSYMISILKDTGFVNILTMVAIIDELIEFAMRKSVPCKLGNLLQFKKKILSKFLFKFQNYVSMFSVFSDLVYRGV